VWAIGANARVAPRCRCPKEGRPPRADVAASRHARYGRRSATDGGRQPTTPPHSMKLSPVPAAVIAANQDVHASLAQASKLTQSVQAGFETRGIRGASVADLSRALGHAEDAVKGVEQLGGTNLLDGTFQRYANHSVRDLRDAVALLERGSLSKDGAKLFGEKLFDAEVATRLGSEAGERSLARPALQRREQASSGDGSDSNSSGGPTWVDGAWLDELGNPARGGNGWAGPDGERFGSDGSSIDGGWTGPDGESFSGI